MKPGIRRAHANGAIAIVATATLVTACNGGMGRLGIFDSRSSDYTILYTATTDDGEQLYVKDGGRKPKQITQGETDYFGDFDISEENGVVAFARSVDGEVGIHTLQPDDSQPTQIVDRDMLDTGADAYSYSQPVIRDDIAVSPNGDAVAFTTTGTGYALHIVNTDGTGLRLLLDSGHETDYVRSPAFSPDGRQIAFVRTTESYHDYPSGIYVMGRDGSGMRMVVDTRETGSGIFDDLVWSPDGEKLALLGQDGDALYVVNSDGNGGIDQVLETSPGEGADTIGTPVFSPDGSTIAYRRFVMGDPTAALSGSNLDSLSADIFVVNVDSSDVRQLTDEGNELDAAGNPDFTPDGNWVVFSGGPVSPTASLDDFGVFEVNLKGSGVQKLVTAAADDLRVGSR